MKRRTPPVHDPVLSTSSKPSEYIIREGFVSPQKQRELLKVQWVVTSLTTTLSLIRATGTLNFIGFRNIFAEVSLQDRNIANTRIFSFDKGSAEPIRSLSNWLIWISTETPILHL